MTIPLRIPYGLYGWEDDELVKCLPVVLATSTPCSSVTRKDFFREDNCLPPAPIFPTAFPLTSMYILNLRRALLFPQFRHLPSLQLSKSRLLLRGPWFNLPPLIPRRHNCTTQVISSYHVRLRAGVNREGATLYPHLLRTGVARPALFGRLFFSKLLICLRLVGLYCSMFDGYEH